MVSPAVLQVHHRHQKWMYQELICRKNIHPLRLLPLQMLMPRKDMPFQNAEGERGSNAVEAAALRTYELSLVTEWLRALRLEDYRTKVQKWIEDHGAADLNEVLLYISNMEFKSPYMHSLFYKTESLLVLMIYIYIYMCIYIHITEVMENAEELVTFLDLKFLERKRVMNTGMAVRCIRY